MAEEKKAEKKKASYLYLVYGSQTDNFFFMKSSDKKAVVEAGKQSGKFGTGFVDAIEVAELPALEKSGQGITTGVGFDDPEKIAERKKTAGRKAKK